MSEAEYQIERNLERSLRVPSFSSNTVDTRSILHRFDCESLKDVAKEMYEEGKRTSPEYEEMNVNIMNSVFALSDKQKNALITYIMYAK